MGYYTNFEIEVSERQTEILEEIRDNHDYIADMFDDSGVSFDEYKWYEHETDMIDISKEYPNVVFTLKGEGEESGDVWRKYFKNGKIQRCHAKITFDDYDESKLTKP